MPSLVSWFGRMLVTFAGQIVVSALLALGIGIATTAVVSSLGIGDNIRDMLGGAGFLYNWVGFFGMDTCITIILSAWAGRMAKDALRGYMISTGKTLPPGV
jgi:hypothetical protein